MAGTNKGLLPPHAIVAGIYTKIIQPTIRIQIILFAEKIKMSLGKIRQIRKISIILILVD